MRSTSYDCTPEGALVSGGQVDIYSREQCGYLAQYFAVGVIYGGLPATIYGFFIGYLNVPLYVYASATVITTLPWSFKFAFGLINDCYPIAGHHRKPYMVMGWTVCAAMLVVLWRTPLPPPYWCQDASGQYITTNGTDAHGGPCKQCHATQHLHLKGVTLQCS